MTQYIPLIDYVDAYLADPDAPKGKQKKGVALLRYQPSIDMPENMPQRYRASILSPIINALAGIVITIVVLSTGIGLVVGLFYFIG